MTARRTPVVVCLLKSTILAAVVLGTGACGNPGGPDEPIQAPVGYVPVTGNFAIGSVGGTTQLRANANTSSSTQDVTSQATWASSNESIATVSSGGLVTARGAGLTVITATYQGISGPTGIAIATAVNLTWTWAGTSMSPSSSITMAHTHSGDALSGTSTVVRGGAQYLGAVTGTVSGGTVIMAGQASDSAGSLYSSWTDEHCAMESPNSMKCVNPMTEARGNFTLTELSFTRQ